MQAQPKTGLPRRLYIGGSGCCETRNGILNRILEGISRVQQDLMEVYIDFEILSGNKSQDVKLGRTDAHSLGLFVTDDVDLNEEAMQMLDGGLLFPCAAGDR